MDASDRIKKRKKKTINPINKKDNKCFPYNVTVGLNQGEIKKDPQRMTKVKPFIDKCNWERINYTSEKDDWKNLRKKMFLMCYTIKNGYMSCLCFKT